MMHATRDQLPVLFGSDAAGIRSADWGDQRVAFISIPTALTSLRFGKGSMAIAAYVR